MANEHRNLAWRNLVADWHLAQGEPDCGCDDDTPEDDLCHKSQEWADQRIGMTTSSELDGPPDKWSHDIWVAAWGKNETLVVQDRDFRLPKPPAGTNWLLTRMLVRGAKAIEVSLMKTTKEAVTVMGRGRVIPDADAVFAKANEILQQVVR